MSKATIVRKSCGHVGVVRGDYIWDSVVCTLCEENKMPSEARILARTEVDELPELSGRRLEDWMARRLEQSERQQERQLRNERMNDLDIEHRRNRNDKPE
ncbi:hypothetical protein HY642_00270 [Candidatus Woesearchaeota archaeon]|nr:hypothetical protein [Candidatus Woesearchaeota archaeon]